MANLTKDQVIKIIQNRPPGTSPEGIVAALRQQGHTLEGYDTSITPAQPEPSLFERASGILNSIVNTQRDLSTGFLKGAGKTAVGMGEAGASAMAKIFGDKFSVGQLPNQLRQKLETQGAAQKVGEFSESAAELLTPMGEEAAVAKAGELLKSAPKLRLLAKALTRAELDAAKFGGQELFKSGDTEKAKTSAKVGAVGGAAGELFSGIVTQGFPYIAKKLEQYNLRLTPAQKEKLGSKVDDVVTWLNSNKTVSVGTPQRRYEKVKAIYNDTEKQLQNFLESNNTAKGIKVSKQATIDELQKLKTGLMRDSADAEVIGRQIDNTITNIKTQYRNEAIPIARLNKLKRTTYEGAYNKAGDKVLNWVEHRIGDIYRQSIEGATKGLKIGEKSIGDFNKEYGTIITARKLLKTASTRNQLGLFGKMMSGFLGEQVGASLGGGSTSSKVGGAVAAPVAGAFAGTLARSLLAAGLSDISKLPTQEAEKVVAKLIADLLNQNQ